MRMLSKVLSTWNLEAGVVWFQPVTSPFLAEMISAVAPAFSSASLGPVSSTCSKPSVTRMATRLPLRDWDMGLPPSVCR